MEDNLNFVQIEDDLNILANGRLPQYFGKWKTTSIVWQMEDNNFGKELTMERPKTKIGLTSDVPFSKRYLKYWVQDGVPALLDGQRISKLRLDIIMGHGDCGKGGQHVQGGEGLTQLVQEPYVLPHLNQQLVQHSIGHVGDLKQSVLHQPVLHRELLGHVGDATYTSRNSTYSQKVVLAI
jgi:hypothetical protein